MAERCHCRFVAPFSGSGDTCRAKGAPLALEPELLQRYSAHSALVEAARPALGEAHLFLADADSMIPLTDPSGLILETAGDPRTVDFGHLVHPPARRFK